MKPLIRRARRGDLDALVPLMVAFNAFEHIEWDPIASRPALELLLATEDVGVVFVAEDDGALGGYAIVTWSFDLEFGGRDAGLTDLFVSPSHRRHGVGRALIDAIAETAVARGASALHLLVDPTNAPAKALYARSGFARNHREPMTRRLRPRGE
jgi:GNAT superfamily N-acetyltransferase